MAKDISTAWVVGGGIAVFGGLLWFLYDKPRFVGDKARVGDLAGVPAGALAGSPLLPPGSASVVVRVDRATKDTIEGPVVGYTTVEGGTISFHALTAVGPTLTVARANVNAIEHSGKIVTA